MTVLETLLARASQDVVTDPGPDDQAIRTMVEAALRAPDHGKLRPWRFLIIRGEARTKLGHIFACALEQRDPNAAATSVAKERERPLRAPVVIAVVAHLTPSPKIPEIEQVLSAGAAAMNILNAAHALGFGAAWKTGAAVYDAYVHHELGLEPTDRLLGFLYVGTLGRERRTSPRPEALDFMKEWQ